MVSDLKTVYHGTGTGNLAGLINKGPELRTTSHAPNAHMYAGFSTSEDLDIAKLFALRRSPPELINGTTLGAGVVLEYVVDGVTPRDFMYLKEPGVLQDEKEVFFFRPGNALELVAIHQIDKDENWVRHSTNVEVAISVMMSFAINVANVPAAVFEALPLEEQRMICAPHVVNWLASAGGGDSELGVIEGMKFGEPASSLCVCNERFLETDSDES